MRVTNSMLITNMLSNLNTNLNVMSRKQDELSTGKRVLFASDDPVAAAKIMKFKTDIADMTQYADNTQSAQSILDSNESSVAEMGNVLQRVRELTVQAANGTLTAADTQKIEEEIIQLRDHLISGGNSNFAGRYQFSSHYTDKALLTSAGKYNIPITKEDLVNKPVSIVEISPKEYMPTGTHGLDLFGYVLDASAFTTNMPDDTAVEGVSSKKPAVISAFDLTVDYSSATLSVGVNGTTFNIDTTNLKGTVLKPLDMQTVLNSFRDKTVGGVKLSEVADVYFDMNKNLIIRDKTYGAAANVTLTASTGLSNINNITDPDAPVAITSGTVVNGVNSVGCVVSAAAGSDFIPEADFYGKRFVMTVNGLTNTITFPTSGTAAALKAGIQTSIDAAFGAGKVVVSSPPISFSTIASTSTTEPEQPNLRIQAAVTTEPKLIQDMNTFIAYLEAGKTTEIGTLMSTIDGHLQQLLAVRADIGARNSRLDLVGARIAENSVTFTRLLSNSQDADMAEVIMYLKNAENVYKSALSVGGRIIQPSLLDFIR